MYKWLMVFCVVFLAGCWGPQFEARSDFGDDPSTTTDTGTSDTTSTTGTTGGVGGATVTTGTDSGTATTSSTTGSAGGAGNGTTTTTASTSTSGGAGGTDSGACAPPDAIPELGQPRAWLAYDEPHSNICMGGAANGIVHCNGEPCGEFSMPATVTPWSEDGLVLKVAYEATDDQPFQMVLECEEAYTCDYVFRPREMVYFLELRRTATGYAVKAFYLNGADPAAEAVSMQPEAQPAVFPVPSECSRLSNPNEVITAFWNQYVDWVRALTWDCDGKLN